MNRDRRRSPGGLTLIELLMVIAVLGLLAAVVLPSAQPSQYDRLRSAARILAGDLAYARSLAVSNGSHYRVVFEPEQNRYVVEHTGANGSLDVLPDSPFREPGDPTDRQVVDLARLPNLGAPVQLVGAATHNGSYQTVDEIEFGPLGATGAASPTVVWLAAGSGDGATYISVKVNPVTGLAEVGGLTTVLPAPMALPAAKSL